MLLMSIAMKSSWLHPATDRFQADKKSRFVYNMEQLLTTHVWEGKCTVQRVTYASSVSGILALQYLINWITNIICEGKQRTTLGWLAAFLQPQKLLQQIFWDSVTSTCACNCILTSNTFKAQLWYDHKHIWSHNNWTKVLIPPLYS